MPGGSPSMASDGKKRAGPRPCSDFLMSARNPRLLHGTNGLVRGVGGGKPRRRASSSQDLDHAWGRREPVFRLVLRPVTLARRHLQIKHDATIRTGNATPGARGRRRNSGAPLRHRDDAKARAEGVVCPCVFAADPVCLASVPIPKFAGACRTLRKRTSESKDTSNSMILVPL